MRIQQQVAIRLFSSLVSVLSVTGVGLVGGAMADDARALPGGRVGGEYRLMVPGRGGVPPYKWRVVDPNHLPPGITLSEQGELVGKLAEEGTFHFTVELQDSERTTARQLVRIRVEPLGTLRPLKIKTDKVPEAIVNQPFDVALAAEGGVPPYTWTVAQGTLPTGLALRPDGAIAGSATEATKTTVVVKVQDSQSSAGADIREISVSVRSVTWSIWYWIAAVVAGIALVLLWQRLQRWRNERRCPNPKCRMRFALEDTQEPGVLRCRYCKWEYRWMAKPA
jgi:hypothetical protein